MGSSPSLDFTNDLQSGRSRLKAIYCRFDFTLGVPRSVSWPHPHTAQTFFCRHQFLSGFHNCHREAAPPCAILRDRSSQQFPAFRAFLTFSDEGIHLEDGLAAILLKENHSGYNPTAPSTTDGFAAATTTKSHRRRSGKETSQSLMPWLPAKLRDLAYLRHWTELRAVVSTVTAPRYRVTRR
jgi:hypothetical protein